MSSRRQLLKRQSDEYARRGIELPLSTVWSTLPKDHLHRLSDVLAQARRAGAGAGIPAGHDHRLCAYVRKIGHSRAPTPLAVVCALSRDCSGTHPERYVGILQADAYPGSSAL